MVYIKFNPTLHGVSDYWRSACFLTLGCYNKWRGWRDLNSHAVDDGYWQISNLLPYQIRLTSSNVAEPERFELSQRYSRPISFQDCSLEPDLGTAPHIELWHIAVLMERIMGIEPTYSAWKADILPLNYIRISRLNLAGDWSSTPR